MLHVEIPEYVVYFFIIKIPVRISSWFIFVPFIYSLRFIQVSLEDSKMYSLLKIILNATLMFC